MHLEAAPRALPHAPYAPYAPYAPHAPHAPHAPLALRVERLPVVCTPASGRTTPAWDAALALIEREVPFTRRTVRPGEWVQRAGDAFSVLRIVNAGALKIVSSNSDGVEQVTGMQFKGGWIGFDGLASGHYACDATATDVSQIWTLDYLTLLAAAARVPALMHTLHVAISGQMEHDRAWRLAICTLPADARVALLLCDWAASLLARSLRVDPFILQLTRTELASYLGMTQETLSRAFRRLRLRGLIRFADLGRQAVSIPCRRALTDFVAGRRDADAPLLLTRRSR